MKKIALYQVPDPDDIGCSSDEEYLTINSVGLYQFYNGWDHTFRKNGRHDFYLSFHQSGPMVFGTKENNNQIYEGTAFIYKPFEEQYYGPISPIPICNYWIHFTGYGVEDLFRKAEIGEKNVFHLGNSKEITSIFDQIIDEFRKREKLYLQYSSTLLQQLIFLISKRDQYSRKLTPKEFSINETIEFLHHNVDLKISLNELANMAGYSISRYCHIFKDVTSFSPQQYIIHLKLEKAKQLMMDSRLSIQQIALEAGFNDQLYFSRLFKKHEGISPLHFRQNQSVREDRKRMSDQ
jgi:AraC-like DNA-binding protein